MTMSGFTPLRLYPQQPQDDIQELDAILDHGNLGEFRLFVNRRMGQGDTAMGGIDRFDPCSVTVFNRVLSHYHKKDEPGAEIIKYAIEARLYNHENVFHWLTCLCCSGGYDDGSIITSKVTFLLEVMMRNPLIALYYVVAKPTCDMLSFASLLCHHKSANAEICRKVSLIMEQCFEAGFTCDMIDEKWRRNLDPKNVCQHCLDMFYSCFTYTKALEGIKKTGLNADTALNFIMARLMMHLKYWLTVDWAYWDTMSDARINGHVECCVTLLRHIIGLPKGKEAVAKAIYQWYKNVSAHPKYCTLVSLLMKAMIDRGFLSADDKVFSLYNIFANTAFTDPPSDVAVNVANVIWFTKNWPFDRRVRPSVLNNVMYPANLLKYAKECRNIVYNPVELEQSLWYDMVVMDETSTSLRTIDILKEENITWPFTHTWSIPMKGKERRKHGSIVLLIVHLAKENRDMPDAVVESFVDQISSKLFLDDPLAYEVVTACRKKPVGRVLWQRGLVRALRDLIKPCVGDTSADLILGKFAKL